MADKPLTPSNKPPGFTQMLLQLQDLTGGADFAILNSDSKFIALPAKNLHVITLKYGGFFFFIKFKIDGDISTPEIIKIPQGVLNDALLSPVLNTIFARELFAYIDGEDDEPKDELLRSYLVAEMIMSVERSIQGDTFSGDHTVGKEYVPIRYMERYQELDFPIIVMLVQYADQHITTFLNASDYFDMKLVSRAIVKDNGLQMIAKFHKWLSIIINRSEVNEMIDGMIKNMYKMATLPNAPLIGIVRKGKNFLVSVEYKRPMSSEPSYRFCLELDQDLALVEDSYEILMVNGHEIT